MSTQKPHSPLWVIPASLLKATTVLSAKTMNRVGNTRSTVTLTSVRSDHGMRVVSLADVRTVWYFIARIFRYV